MTSFAPLPFYFSIFVIVCFACSIVLLCYWPDCCNSKTVIWLQHNALHFLSPILSQSLSKLPVVRIAQMFDLKRKNKNSSQELITLQFTLKDKKFQTQKQDIIACQIRNSKRKRTIYKKSTKNSTEPPLKYRHLPTKVGPILQ